MASSTCKRVYVQNIACSSRDEHGKYVHQKGDEPVRCSPLKTRLAALIENIISQDPDVVVLFEAGRSSQGHSWTRMACEIENATGLTYAGLMYANMTATPFAHAIFINRKNAHLEQFKNYQVAKGDNGVDAHVTTATIRFSDETYVTVGGVHMPINETMRAEVTEWLVQNHHLATFWAGDFNTFPDSNGPWMLERLNSTDMIHAKCQVDYTFRGFDYDTIKVAHESRHLLHPMSKVVEETETHAIVLPVSILDHVYISDHSVETAVTFLPLTSASDHCGILIQVL